MTETELAGSGALACAATEERMRPASKRTPEEGPEAPLPLREILDGDLERGVALFDAELRLAYANPAARVFLQPVDGAVVARLRHTIVEYRDRLARSDAAPPPREVTLVAKGGRRAHAAISVLAKTTGPWFAVRISPPGTFTEPNVRRLQSRFRLTLREAQVAVGVARGSTNGAVALELGICEKTVKNALLEVFRKCRVRNRVELAVRAHDGPTDA